MKKEDYHKYHKELWDWLSKNPKNDKGLTWKEDWPGWEYDGDNIKNGKWIGEYCFACGYDDKYGVGDCDFCPITWAKPRKGEEDVRCMNSIDSPFRRWDSSKDPAERSRLAAIIRDLPWEDKE